MPAEVYQGDVPDDVPTPPGPGGGTDGDDDFRIQPNSWRTPYNRGPGEGTPGRP